MYKIKYALLLITLIALKANAQELTCADFRVGTFIIPTPEDVTNYTITSKDSITKVSTARDTTVNKYIVIRENQHQTEWANGINVGNPFYEIIEWIDDCTYRLTFDASKMELDEDERMINENNGIVFSKLRIEGKCMFYEASMLTNNNQKVSQEGIICIE